MAPGRHRRALLLAAGAAAVLALGACGPDEDAASTAGESPDRAVETTAPEANGPDATSPDATPPTSAGVDGSGSYVALTDTSCAELAGPVVAGALGVEVTGASATETGDGCSFTGGLWVVTFTSTALDPATTATTPVLPTIPGIDLPHMGTVQMTRSGRWTGEVSFVSGDRMVQLSVANGAAGSDTSMPTDGPPQEPVTRQATVDLVNALAAT